MTEHPVVHIEFSAKDPQAASEFYKQVFDWKIEHASEMDYYMFAAEPGPGGGFNTIDGETTQAGDVLVYIQTGDIQATLEAIESLGGKALTPKTEIPNTGWFAIFSDPSGNRVGLYTGMQPNPSS
ncbi:MAG: VOC family protein [Anaerolineales bacterium]|nr:VOC family protein [Anaerolineales bacterium]